MPKLPEPPAAAVLAGVAPDLVVLPAGSTLARIFSTGGAHPVRWDEFRHWGPGPSRFDHHVLDARGQPHVQPRGIYYAAGDEPPGGLAVCAAEVFQETRIISRSANGACLVISETARPLVLVNLLGAFATRIGASALIASGPKSRARRWSQALYDAYPQADGIAYRASMGGSAPIYALFERAASAIPARPRLERRLTDPAMRPLIMSAAARIGYGVI